MVNPYSIPKMFEDFQLSFKHLHYNCKCVNRFRLAAQSTANQSLEYTAL